MSFCVTKCCVEIWTKTLRRFLSLSNTWPLLSKFQFYLDSAPNKKELPPKNALSPDPNTFHEGACKYSAFVISLLKWIRFCASSNRLNSIAYCSTFQQIRAFTIPKRLHKYQPNISTLFNENGRVQFAGNIQSTVWCPFTTILCVAKHAEAFEKSRTGQFDLNLKIYIKQFKLDSNGVPVAQEDNNVEGQLYARHQMMMDKMLHNREVNAIFVDSNFFGFSASSCNWPTCKRSWTLLKRWRSTAGSEAVLQMRRSFVDTI